MYFFEVSCGSILSLVQILFNLLWLIYDNEFETKEKIEPRITLNHNNKYMYLLLTVFEVSKVFIISLRLNRRTAKKTSGPYLRIRPAKLANQSS